MQLVLVVNVMNNCSEGVAYPEDKSRWAREDLVNVIRLAGIPFINAHQKYTDLIQTLFTFLNTQKVYALYFMENNDRYLIVNSSSIRVTDATIHLGESVKLQKMDSLVTCFEVWNKFIGSNAPKFTMSAKPETCSTKQQEMKEANLIIKSLTARLDAQNKELKELKSANSTLTTEMQVKEAKFIELTERFLELQRVLRK
jgi:hypothetical protein